MKEIDCTPTSNWHYVVEGLEKRLGFIEDRLLRLERDFMESEGVHIRLDFIEARLVRFERDYLERRLDPKNFVPARGANDTGTVSQGEGV